ncbi:MAG: SUMF1/EgtB/PvdO family nonheme iron enzyme [Myxococcales bacterium]
MTRLSAFLVLCVACREAPTQNPEPSAPVASQAERASRRRVGRCPADMVPLQALDSVPFCMDPYEAPNVRGDKPYIMENAVSGNVWCAQRGKRLCYDDEWEVACGGPGGLVYPYGNEYQPGRCNDGKTWIQVDERLLAEWPSKASMLEASRLYQGTLAGSLPGCVSVYGVVDLVGNVEEWTLRRDGSAVLKGCYWAGCYGGSKPTCRSTNGAHADSFRFYETGFRCCRDG